MATLEQALETASQLPPEQQEMLAHILRQRQIEAWRQKTGSEAQEWISAFHEGSLTPESAEETIGKLRKNLESRDSE